MKRAFGPWFGGPLILAASLALAAPPGPGAANVPATLTTSPTPRDFAEGIPLTVEPGGAIYGLDLPDALYAGVTRPDLGDARVFNAQGERLPHVLRRPQSRPASPGEAKPVPLFPLYDESPTHLVPSSQWRVRAGPDGTLVEVTGGGAPPANQRPRAYLLDLSQWRGQSLAGLRLRWGAPPASGFLSRVTLEVSDDLAQWRPAGAGVLADLEFGGQRLQRVNLTPSAWGAYVRVAWPDALGATDLLEARVLPGPGTAPEPARRHREIPGQFVAGPKAGFEFDGGALLPVERIQVRPPQTNSLARAVISSRATPAEPWRERHRGALYALTMEDIRLRNEPIPLPALVHRYWRLETSGEGDGFGSGVPVLELEWVAHELLFLARGPGPYLLAYGSARVGPPGDDAASLLEQLARDPQRVRPAQAGVPQALAGTGVLAPLPIPLPWRQIALWGVLLLCVLALGWMAWRVYRQLASPAPPAGPDTPRAPERP